MCLYTRKKEPEIAIEDIKVFKIVSVVDGKYYAPFQGKPLTETPEGEVSFETEYCYQYTSKGIIPYPLYSIGKGVIHAYLNESIVDSELDTMRCCCSGKYKVIEGIIPAGTEYWVGNSFDVCARCIKFDEKYLNRR